ncbi:caspase-1 [Drosophila tropicalis]|uniref:caspase-1 n=1 Tax=Drosophila tropicalis TaxID=46794 RepID=UPI0035AC1D63
MDYQDTNEYDAHGFLPKSSSIRSTSKVNSLKKLSPAEVYIFNHEKFDNPKKERHGSDKDVKALEKAFQKFKCKVKVITDASVNEVKRTVNDLKQANFEEHSALVIVVLSHGNRNDKIMGRDSKYSLNDDVLFPILLNRTLDGKPKILIVQACKGHMNSRVRRSATYCSEVLKCYSALEGFVSRRNVETGTIFIQTFCEIFEKMGKKNHIEAIMTEVRKEVTKLTDNRQTPSVTSTMTREYVFGNYM